MSMGDTITSRSGTDFLPAMKELTSEDIAAQYGALLSTASLAFREDPNYFIAMAENAAMIAYKRATWELRMEAQRNVEARTDGEGATAEEIKAEAARLMAERGLSAPPRAPRQRRSRASA